MSGAGGQLLRDRVRRLDAGPPGDPEAGPDGLLVHAVRVLSTYTDMAPPDDPDLLVEAAEADGLARSGQLLATLAAAAPAVTGPLDRDRQHWIATARHRPPSADRFAGGAGTAPADSGLWTSTAATSRCRSMWRLYLDDYHGSDLFPLPWQTWRLPVGPDARVREIGSAADWADFVTAYPRRTGAGVQPDWPAVAADLDGVHVTLGAVAAAQGVRLRTPYGPTSRAFWDVESTRWLRWRFGTPEQVERTT